MLQNKTQVDATVRVRVYERQGCLRAKLGFASQVANVHNLTRKQIANNRRLFDNFQNLAIAYQCPAVRNYSLDGNVDEALVSASEEYGIGLMGVQLPPGSRGVPPHLVPLLRSCRGGVLVFQEATAGDKSAIATQFQKAPVVPPGDEEGTSA